MLRIVLLVIFMVLIRKFVIAVEQWSRRTEADENDDEPTGITEHQMLLVLRSSAFAMSSDDLEAAAHRAWGQLPFARPSRSKYVDRWSPNMIVLEVGGSAVLVIGAPLEGRQRECPLEYFPNSADSLWNRFTHDVSVGMAYVYEHNDIQIHELLGRLVAELCDEESIAVCHPMTRRLWAIDDTILDTLHNQSSKFFVAS